jgi:putative sugar O-methyltransferase
MKLIYKSILTFAAILPQFCFAGKISSISDSPSYTSSCLQAASNLTNFKRDKNYTAILEHTSFKQGLHYVNYIKKNYPHLLCQIDKIKINDSIGNPRMWEYPLVGKISPSTLRYAKIAGDLQFFFGNLDRYRIFEIGAGYGGQALILSQLYTLSNYSLVDLDEALQLQDAYLNHFHVSHQLVQFDNMDHIEEIDLIISNYAFTECNREIQEQYLKKVISKASKGYMICNQTAQVNGIDALSKAELIFKLSELGFQVKVLEETPNTFVGNYLLVFEK